MITVDRDLSADNDRAHRLGRVVAVRRARSTGVHGGSAGGRLRVQVRHLPLRPMEGTRCAVRRAHAAFRQLPRRHHGPVTVGRARTLAVPPVRRPTVFRRVRGPEPRAGAPRPRAGAHRHGRRLRALLRPHRWQHVVQTRKSVRAPVQHARPAVEVDPGQAESHVHVGQTQVHVGRHTRVHRSAHGQLERADRRQRRYVSIR